MTISATLAPLIALSIKLLTVSILAQRITVAGQWLASWVIVQAAMTAAMVGLSYFSALSSYTIWILLIAGLLIAGALARSIPIPRLPTLPTKLFALLVFVLLVRAQFLNDPTWDAQTYGLARLAIWMNYQSLFVVMPTENVNLFSNEWNGELNSLLYGFAAGNVQGLAIGNIETLIVMFVATSFFLCTLGTSRTVGTAAALAIAATPAIVGLAVTVKGDLLACAAVLMAVAWSLCQRQQNGGNFYVALAIAAASLAVGSKVTAIFSAVAALSILPIPRRNAWIGVALGGIGAVIFTARYFANIFQFGGPLARVGGEAPQIGLATLSSNLNLTGKMMTSFYYTPPLFLTALAGGLGFCFILLAVSALCSNRLSRLHKGMAFAGLVAFICGAASIPSQPFSFRYLLPALLLTVGPFAAVGLAQLGKRATVSISCIVVIANLFAFLPPNEVIPTEDPKFYRLLANGTAMVKGTVSHPYFISDARIAELKLDDRDHPKTIAIYAPLSRPIFVFSGSYAQNRLHLAPSAAALGDVVKQSKPNFAIIVKADPVAAASASDIASLITAGCQQPTDNNWFIIAEC